MSDQLQLDLAVRSAESAVRTAERPRPVQLSELPGTEWEHIFGLPAPGDGPDGPFGAWSPPSDAEAAAAPLTACEHPSEEAA